MYLSLSSSIRFLAKRLAGVKLAYVGRPSRAEFPLTRAFAEGSSNSTVGLTGRALYVDDLRVPEPIAEAGAGERSRP